MNIIKNKWVIGGLIAGAGVLAVTIALKLRKGGEDDVDIEFDEEVEGVNSEEQE